MRGLLAARGTAVTGGAAAAAPRRGQIAPEQEQKLVGAAVAKAAQALYRLPVMASECRLGAASLAELLEFIPERGLIAVLDGTGEALGVMAMSPSVTAAIIEFQTMGRIAGQNPEPRRPTRTDAVICAEFVNACMVDLLTHQLPGLGWSGRWRYASFLEDARPLGLMLDDVNFATAQLTLRLGAGGQREGQMLIALPRHCPTALSSPPPRPDGTATIQRPPAATPSFSEQLRAKVLDSPVTLNAVLCRKRISLRELRQLGAGTIISLPAGVLSQARLETRQGRLLAQGKLGEAEGFHALRLSAPDARPDLQTASPATKPHARAATNHPASPDKISAAPGSVPDFDPPGFESRACGAADKPDVTDFEPATLPDPDPLRLAGLDGPDSFRPEPENSTDVLPLSFNIAKG